MSDTETPSLPTKPPRPTASSTREKEPSVVTVSQLSLLSPEHIEAEETSDDRFTPRNILDCVDAFWPDGIELDPCWSPRSLVKAHETMTIAQDGRSVDWGGRRVFCNPPWSDPAWWFRMSYENQNTIYVSRLDVTTAAWKTWGWRAAAICWAGRVKYHYPDGRKRKTPAFETAVLYYGPDTRRFSECFSGLGVVTKNVIIEP